jgi:hypothetical protein
LQGPFNLSKFLSKEELNARIYGRRNSGRRKVLFVTSEFEDFVKVGGLGEVSSALPRALLRWCDVRVLLPGYRQVMAQGKIDIVGRCDPSADLPPCDLGKLQTPDGLVVYILICPELYDREGSPYGDLKNRDWSDNDVRFARLGLQRPSWPPAGLTLIGPPTCCMSTIGRRRSLQPVSRGAARTFRAFSQSIISPIRAYSRARASCALGRRKVLTGLTGSNSTTMYPF